METATPRGHGGCSVFGIAVAAALLTTLWWGITALDNFGSDCLFYLGDGPRAEHCYLVNDRAKAWLPRLVSAAWISAVLVLCLPRRFSRGPCTVAGVTVACLVFASVLGFQASTASSP
ncbi:hypothetical protein [Streptomyces sp. CNZ748]|uniref:hypothetical protein n=1 Tax=Streptomyces sp. CNZ748 TaxID=2885160 RepID=UPI001E2F60B7|nr:hypothetical protein [Streptomyces sp. CNZ748]